MSRRVLLYAGLVLAVAVILLPVAWMIFASLKPEADITGHPAQLLPQHLTGSNYREVTRQIPFVRQFINSVIFAGGVTVFSLLFNSMTAFALARLDFPGRRVLFVAIILFLMIPYQVTLIPTYQIVAKLGLMNTFPGLIIPRATNAFGIFFLRQFFLGIPRSLDEAARIDGAGDWRIYARIILPLSTPALLTIALFDFMFNWNDLLWPLIFTTSTKMETLPAGLALFMGQHVTQYGVVMAGATLTTVPIVIAFLFVQRRFIQGIATTGLK
ncbi:carbohydrate ABC transporter permease [Actinoallomurus rhizosphaericola]|uniref:carbohydrate ABC transporter permease n=1 Tax=Actinoallomurus rhizosphaericola TaxID=2952536 RepID=UPI0020936B16|nr:carbohydrate ABC transporter permease [Actinoallomurus rhizosphaericola]MCO5996776.1 carbohydrate ABC transporter permease [Actinoallomurus rhizosphaericola]